MQKINDLIPLKKVNIQCNITGSMVDLIAELHYRISPTEEHLDAIYEFPVDQKTILRSFEADIDGKIIVSKVKTKEEARAGSIRRRSVARGPTRKLLINQD